MSKWEIFRKERKQIVLKYLNVEISIHYSFKHTHLGGSSFTNGCPDMNFSRVIRSWLKLRGLVQFAKTAPTMKF